MFSIFTTFPIRMLGYGFAVGEAMRYRYTEEKVDMAYSIGMGYVVAHVIFEVTTRPMFLGSLVGGLKTIAWQGLASCWIPTICNYYVCRVVYRFVCKYQPETDDVKHDLVPYMVGLCMLPFYMGLVDPLVTLMVEPVFLPLTLMT